jgi:hypothetical protein
MRSGEGPIPRYSKLPLTRLASGDARHPLPVNGEREEREPYPPVPSAGAASATGAAAFLSTSRDDQIAPS